MAGLIPNYFFKAHGRGADRLLAASPQQLAVSTITVFELETGLRKSNAPKARRRQIAAFTASMQVWPFDARAAFAVIRTELERLGTPIRPLDALIAGAAIAGRATMAFRNLPDFQWVANLSVAKWFLCINPRAASNHSKYQLLHDPIGTASHE